MVAQLASLVAWVPRADARTVNVLAVSDGKLKL
jgi:hypothetical protein